MLAAALVAGSDNSPLGAQRAPVGPAARSFVRIDTSIVVLANVRVIDGTGAPAREGQSLVVRDGRIVAMGDAKSVAVPVGAQVVDLAGRA